MYSNILRQIANILFLNTQNLKSSGLLNGQLGVAIFFYKYSDYSANEMYRNFADKLVESIYDSIPINGSKDFYSGLSGIGWGINYIIENNYVQVDDDVLSNVDKVIGDINILNLKSELVKNTPLFSKGLYVSVRGDKESIDSTLNQCCEFLSSNDLPTLPLCYINSVLYFTLRASNGSDAKVGLKIIELLSSHIVQTIDKKLYNNGDLLYLEKYRKEVCATADVSSAWPFSDERQMPIAGRTKYEPLNYLYDSIDEQPSLSEIQSFIDSVIYDLDNDNMTVLNGLAGIGIELIRNKDKYNAVGV